MRSLVTLAPSFTLLVLAACGGVRREAPTIHKARPCGDAAEVALADGDEAGGVFRRLRGALSAPMTLACPGGGGCTLPPDRQLTLRVAPRREVACSFAACRVPYLSSLPFEHATDDPCPEVLWTVATVTLESDRGTVIATAPDVNVLATRRGEAFLRFMLENPASLQRTLTGGAPRATLLDVQIEAAPTRVRGQLSALSAPLPAQPAAELRFAALWSANWESALPP